MRALFTLAVLLAAGCFDYSPRPGQEEAQAIVWHQLLGEFDCPAPRVIWGADCTMPNGTPGVNDGWDRNWCGYGYTIPSRPSVVVLVWLGSFSAVPPGYNDPPFVHEHVHAWHWCHGIDDQRHKRAEWEVLPPAGRAQLRAEGL